VVTNCETYSCPELRGELKALGQLNQEQMCPIVGRALDIPTVALRYFNAYEPGQRSRSRIQEFAPFSRRGVVTANRQVIFDMARQPRLRARVVPFPATLSAWIRPTFLSARG